MRYNLTVYFPLTLRGLTITSISLVDIKSSEDFNTDPRELYVHLIYIWWLMLLAESDTGFSWNFRLWKSGKAPLNCLHHYAYWDIVDGQSNSMHVTLTPSLFNSPLSYLLHIGAGISVQAGIPDFRSPDGLFQTLKRDNPKEAMSSGKELFDVSVFSVRCSDFL